MRLILRWSLYLIQQNGIHTKMCKLFWILEASDWLLSRVNQSKVSKTAKIVGIKIWQIGFHHLFCTNNIIYDVCTPGKYFLCWNFDLQCFFTHEMSEEIGMQNNSLSQKWGVYGQYLIYIENFCFESIIKVAKMKKFLRFWR